MTAASVAANVASLLIDGLATTTTSTTAAAAIMSTTVVPGTSGDWQQLLVGNSNSKGDGLSHILRMRDESPLATAGPNNATEEPPFIMPDDMLYTGANTTCIVLYR